LDKPLHVIYKVSKLAYRIGVIVIANERVKKKNLYFFGIYFNIMLVRVIDIYGLVMSCFLWCF
jgi:hypothetical protein